MRQEFGNNITRAEQLMRVALAKKPGRKHQKRKGVKAKERDRVRVGRHNALVAARRKAFTMKVAEYWRGERAENPSA